MTVAPYRIYLRYKSMVEMFDDGKEHTTQEIQVLLDLPYSTTHGMIQSMVEANQVYRCSYKFPEGDCKMKQACYKIKKQKN